MITNISFKLSTGFTEMSNTSNQRIRSKNISVHCPKSLQETKGGTTSKEPLDDQSIDLISPIPGVLS